MKISILTLFPEYFEPLWNTSIIKRAKEKDLFEYEVIDFRKFTQEKHGHVDDTPYGGGAGMVLMCQPILDALKSIRTEDSTVILLTPQGQTFNQTRAKELSLKDHLIFICGHYEGFDERIRSLVDMEVSIGDYVLTGGEIPSMIITDSVTRLIDNVIREDSHIFDSFKDNLLDFPVYTKPVDFMGMKVPEVLLSGHHENINKWKQAEALKRTKIRRPDLLERVDKDV